MLHVQAGFHCGIDKEEQFPRGQGRSTRVVPKLWRAVLLKMKENPKMIVLEWVGC